MVAQALTPWEGGPCYSIAALVSHLQPHATITLLCKQGHIDYSFTKQHGLSEVLEFHRPEILEALRDSDHWVQNLLDQAHVVHFNGHWQWEEALLARICAQRNIPYIHQPRGMFLVGHRKRWLKKCYNTVLGNGMASHATRVVALSQFETNQFLPYPIDPKKIVTIPNGITAVHDEKLVSLQRHSNPHIKVDVPYFFYLGRLEHRKNLLFLLDAYLEYRHRGGTAKLVLMGPSEHGYERNLHEYVRAHQCHDVVQIGLPVYDEERWLYMNRSIATVYPSVQEAFGRVPFEAISSGTFTIVPSFSGAAEYLKPFLPECLFDLSDPDSLTDALQRVEAMRSRNETHALLAARQWVHERLSWTSIAQQFYDLYSEIIVETSRVPRAEPTLPPQLLGTAV